MANAGPSHSSMQISCLICNANFSDEEIYGHVALDHFNFLRFGCPNCDFRAPFEDSLVTHMRQRGHGFKANDYSIRAAFGYVSRLANIVTEQSRLAASSENAGYRVLSDLDRLYFSYQAPPQEQELAGRRSPSMQSTVSSVPYYVAIRASSEASPANAVGAMQISPPPQPVSQSRAISRASDAASVNLHDLATPEEEEHIEGEAASEYIEDADEVEFLGEDREFAAPEPVLDGHHNEEMQEPGPVLDQGEDEYSEECTVCKTSVPKSGKQDHVTQHLAESDNAPDEESDPGGFYTQAYELWKVCFPEPSETDEPADSAAPEQGMHDAEPKEAVVDSERCSDSPGNEEDFEPDLENFLGPGNEQTGPERDFGFRDSLVGNASVSVKLEPGIGNAASAGGGLGMEPESRFRTVPRATVCRICGEDILPTSNRWRARTTHMWTKHSESRPYLCATCGDYSALSLAAFTRHMETSHDEEIDAELKEELMAKEHALMDQCFPSEQSAAAKPADRISAKEAPLKRSGAAKKSQSPIKKSFAVIEKLIRTSLSPPSDSSAQSSVCKLCNRSVTKKAAHVWQLHMVNHSRFICSVCGAESVRNGDFSRLCAAKHVFDANKIEFNAESEEVYMRQYQQCFGHAPQSKALPAFNAHASGAVSAVSQKNVGGRGNSSGNIASLGRLPKQRSQRSVLSAGSKKLSAAISRKRIKVQSAKVKTSLPSVFCHGCKSLVSKISNLGHHVWSCHMNGVKRFTCGVCKQQANWKTQLRDRCTRKHPTVPTCFQEASEDVKRLWEEQYLRCRGEHLRHQANGANSKPKASKSKLMHVQHRSKEAAARSIRAAKIGARSSNPRRAIEHPAITCALCKVSFAGIPFFLQQHVVEKHREGVKLLECSKCGFAKNTKLHKVRKHIAALHADDPTVRLIDRRAEFAEETRKCFEACFPNFQKVGKSETDTLDLLLPSSSHASDENEAASEIEDMDFAFLDFPSTSK